MNENQTNNILLDQFREQRDALLEMIIDLEKIKVKVESLFPEHLDNRQIYRFQEKVKAVTELFKSILDIRKEIIKSVKDEMELRRKFEDNSDIDDILNDADIRKLAARLEGAIKKENLSFNDNKHKIKVVNSNQEEN